jgi:acyl-CoA synthetase (AMP-forming)/AMP-acid ligase II
MSLVRARRNPITGAIVTADIVLERPETDTRSAESEALRENILESCRRVLASYKVPAMIRFVPSLEVSASGKLVRRDA